MLAAERCVARAQGNPLFLEQLSRHVRERGDDAVPATVQTLMQARLDRLDPDDRNALARGLGVRAALHAAGPARRAGPAALRSAPAHPAAARSPVGDGFLFAHALIRDAVYDMLLRSQLRELHRRAAAFFAGARRRPACPAPGSRGRPDGGAGLCRGSPAAGGSLSQRAGVGPGGAGVGHCDAAGRTGWSWPASSAACSSISGAHLLPNWRLARPWRLPGTRSTAAGHIWGSLQPCAWAIGSTRRWLTWTRPRTRPRVPA